MKRILIVCLLLFSMGMANAQMTPRPGHYTDIDYNDYKARHDFYEMASYEYFQYTMGKLKTEIPGYESYTANKLMDEMESYLKYEDPDDEAHAFVAKTYLMTRHCLLKKQERESIDWQWSFIKEDLKSYETDMAVYYKLLPKMTKDDRFSVFVPLSMLGTQITMKGHTKEQSDYKLIDVFTFNVLQYIKYNNDVQQNSSLALQIYICAKFYPNSQSIYTYDKVYNELKKMKAKFDEKTISLLQL